MRGDLHAFCWAATRKQVEEARTEQLMELHFAQEEPKHEVQFQAALQAKAEMQLEEDAKEAATQVLLLLLPYLHLPFRPHHAAHAPRHWPAQRWIDLP